MFCCKQILDKSSSLTFLPLFIVIVFLVSVVVVVVVLLLVVVVVDDDDDDNDTMRLSLMFSVEKILLDENTKKSCCAYM